MNGRIVANSCTVKAFKPVITACGVCTQNVANTEIMIYRGEKWDFYKTWHAWLCLYYWMDSFVMMILKLNVCSPNEFKRDGSNISQNM